MWHADFLVTACELLVAACMQDLVPGPGIKPGPLHWEHGALPTGPPGKFPDYFYSAHIFEHLMDA